VPTPLEENARTAAVLWGHRLFLGQDADRPDLGVLYVRELRAGRTKKKEILFIQNGLWFPSSGTQPGPGRGAASAG
jgi:hypothetical protein